MENWGGYPTELFLRTPDVRLICPLCYSVFCDPRQCVVGHNFCLTCIELALIRKEECPYCRTNMNQDNISKNQYLESCIDELLVRCYVDKEVSGEITMEDKCSWVGPLMLRTKHMKNCHFVHPEFRPPVSQDNCPNNNKRKRNDQRSSASTMGMAPHVELITQAGRKTQPVVTGSTGIVL